MEGYPGLLARTFLIGVLVAAPVGAMGVLCIQRTLARGWRAGLVTGAGIATADGAYAALAAVGVTAVAQWMVAYQAQCRVVGGLVLAWLGWRAAASATPAVAVADAPVALGPLYASAVGLTLTNPMTIMSFAAVFAGAGLAAQAAPGGAALVTAGVLAGSLSWWLALTTGVWAIRRSVSDRAVVAINRVCGALLVVTGVLAVLSGMGGPG